MFTPSSARNVTALLEAGVERRSKVERHDTTRNGSLPMADIDQRVPQPHSLRASCDPLDFHDNRPIVSWRPFQSAMIISS
jgi:hypothetical protein